MASARAAASPPNLKPGNLLRLHNIANARGGRCLSEQYLGVLAPYRFRCAHGHEWQTPGSNVLAGTWCRQCVVEARRGKSQPETARRQSSLTRRAPDGLRRLQQQAAVQGGRCLSEQYLGVNHSHRFRCDQGHEWDNLAMNVLRGQWCSLCRRESWRLTLAHAQQAALTRGGRCLSSTYVDCKTKLTWECDRGHIWSAPLATIRHRGCWCPDCASLARISNRNSKAYQRYADAGKRLLGETPPDG